MQLCYKKLAHKFREYPVPLKIRVGEHNLNMSSDYEYLCLLKNYCNYLAYRILRKVDSIDRNLDLQVLHKVVDRKQYMVYSRERTYIGSDIEDNEIGTFWENYGNNIPDTWWRIHRYAYDEWRIVGITYTKWFEYNAVEDKYKPETTIESFSPVEREFVKTDGPHSVVPWFDTTSKEVGVCGLCHRKYARYWYWPNGYYAKTKPEYDFFMRSTWSNTSTVKTLVVCNGPCADIAKALSFVTFSRSHQKFPLLTIFLGIIEHANHNKNIRRTAENFVRYARQVFEARDNSTRCESNSKVIGQYPEISIN